MSKILAIDDKKDNLITLSALLKALIPDCEVITALSGPEGIEKAKAELPDTILLDIKMPGMDGYEVCKHLKENESTEHIPVIMLTAIKTESVDLVKGLETGADAYLAKPIDEYVLAAQVKTALRIKKAEDLLRNEKDLLKEAVGEKTKELLESEAEKKAILDGITASIRFVDENLDILWVNKASSISVNNSPEEMIGHKCYEFWGHQEQICDTCPAIKSFRDKKTSQVIRHVPDGTVWDLKAEPVFDDKGNLVGVVEIAHDITDKSRLEAQLRQAQKMESMGILAGGIAHDFNNLLMSIQGRASIMLMKKDPSHPDCEHLRGIEDNIESAADLTRQLLGFARGGKYEIKPTDLNEVIKKQNRMFGRTKKEITIQGSYEKDLWSVEVDRGQIEQVLLNLYVNAWQAMPSGGDLHLKTENVTLDETDVKPFPIQPGRYVHISITDTGTGMDKATQERIFEPFFTTKEMGRGTGLGLASVYGIIKNHDGFINVYSERGHGSTFNIYLPVTGAEDIAQEAEHEGQGEIFKGKETILFVDDEDMIIEIAQDLLDLLGYKVLLARSGKEAVEIYQEKKEQIDIVLLDMIMPNMSGSDTYDRIKDINPDCKVILSSGYSIDGQATEILDKGCNGFIQKPFRMKELSQRLRDILGH